MILLFYDVFDGSPEAWALIRSKNRYSRIYRCKTCRFHPSDRVQGDVSFPSNIGEKTKNEIITAHVGPKNNEKNENPDREMQKNENEVSR